MPDRVVIVDEVTVSLVIVAEVTVNWPMLPLTPRMFAEVVLPIVRPVMVVMSADVPVKVVMEPLMPRIVDEVVLPIVRPVMVVMSADDAVIAPETDKLPEVEMLPTAVIVPEARKLLTALEPAVNLPIAAEVVLKLVMVPLRPRMVEDATAPIVTPVTVVILAEA